MLNAADILARAQAWKAQHGVARLPQPGRLATTGPVDSADALRRKMADDMRDIAAVKGCVEPEDLIALGYTQDALTRHGEAARDLANAARERRV